MGHDLISGIAICIIAAWVLAVGAQFFKQPLILAYLVAGFAVGPRGLGWVQDPANIETISEIGLSLLLFMIGLEIDLKTMMSAGRVILWTALVQIVGGITLGVACFMALGFPLGGAGLDALYLALACTLSSTVIIVKILYDKRELDTLAGRVTLGILVLQDLFAILFLAVQPNLRQPEMSVLLLSMGKVALLVLLAYILSRYVLPHVFRSVAHLPELVLVGALAWCFLLAGLANVLNLSREMGALVAGVALSTFPYALDVVAKVTSLRDFFVTLFFVALGMNIPTPTWALLGWAAVMCAFVVASRFLTITPCLHGMKQGHRMSLMPAINLSQLSEFSLVILLLGLKMKHIEASSLDYCAYAFVVLAVGSTYAVTQSDPLVRRLMRALTRLGVKDLPGAAGGRTGVEAKPEIVLLGFSWTASSLLEEISRQEPELLPLLTVIDFNPVVNERLRARGLRAIYGDISQRDTLRHAGVGHARIIVCSLPNSLLKGTNNQRLVQHLREINRTAQIIATSELFSTVPELYAAGADYVSVPRLTEAEGLCAVLQAARQNRLPGKRAEVDAELANRNEIIP